MRDLVIGVDSFFIDFLISGRLEMHGREVGHCDWK